MTKSISIRSLARIPIYDSTTAEKPGESGSIYRLTRRELSVCAKRNRSTCVRITPDFQFELHQTNLWMSIITCIYAGLDAVRVTWRVHTPRVRNKTTSEKSRTALRTVETSSYTYFHVLRRPPLSCKLFKVLVSWP